MLWMKKIGNDKRTKRGKILRSKKFCKIIASVFYRLLDTSRFFYWLANNQLTFNVNPTMNAHRDSAQTPEQKKKNNWKTWQQIYWISANSTISISRCNLKQGHDNREREYPELGFFRKGKMVRLYYELSSLCSLYWWLLPSSRQTIFPFFSVTAASLLLRYSFPCLLHFEQFAFFPFCSIKRRKTLKSTRMKSQTLNSSTAEMGM